MQARRAGVNWPALRKPWTWVARASAGRPSGERFVRRPGASGLKGQNGMQPGPRVRRPAALGRGRRPQRCRPRDGAGGRASARATSGRCGRWGDGGRCFRSGWRWAGATWPRPRAAVVRCRPQKTRRVGRRVEKRGGGVRRVPGGKRRAWRGGGDGVWRAATDGGGSACGRVCRRASRRPCGIRRIRRWRSCRGRRWRCALWP